MHFASCKGSHTGVKIAHEIKKAISQNGLAGKVVYIVTDNASNMRNACNVIIQLQEGLEEAENSQHEGEDEEESQETEELLDQDTVDDETLYNALQDEDQEEVNAVLKSVSEERLSCFAHSLQLALKDGLDKCKSMRSVSSKCCKLANLCHQSALFRQQFEVVFGNGRSVPRTNSTRWSSTYHQLSSVADLDDKKLRDLLCDSGHTNLMMTNKEAESLREVVDILNPWAEVGD